MLSTFKHVHSVGDNKDRSGRRQPPRRNIAQRRYNRLHPKSDGPISMTICIAAICDGGDTIVAIADDKLSYKGVSLSFTEKIVPIQRPIIALLAGNLDFQSAIVDKVRARTGLYDALVPTKLRTRQVAEMFSQAYKEVREDQIQDLILDHYLVSRNTWKNNRTSLDAGTIKNISDDIDDLQLPGVATIIAGVDGSFDKKAESHLYLLEDNKIIDRTSMGFICIGEGADYAHLEFCETPYDRDYPAASMVQTIFLAKKRADEVMPMIGKGNVTAYIVDEDSHFSHAMLNPTVKKEFHELTAKRYELRKEARMRADLLGILQTAKYLRNVRELSSGKKEKTKIKASNKDRKGKSADAKRLQNGSDES